MAQKKNKTSYELVKLPVSGKRCSFYTVYLIEEDTTLLDKFIEENEVQYPEAIDDILDRMEVYANSLGALAKDFRFEGSNLTEFAHALRDHPDQKLRLYCIRYGTSLVVLGSGGPKNVDKWQQNDKLTDEVSFMFQVADDISRKIQDREIEFCNGGLDFKGDLIFDFYD